MASTTGRDPSRYSIQITTIGSSRWLYADTHEEAMKIYDTWDNPCSWIEIHSPDLPANYGSPAKGVSAGPATMKVAKMVRWLMEHQPAGEAVSLGLCQTRILVDFIREVGLELPEQYR